jgi:hypothetical protein
MDAQIAYAKVQFPSNWTLLLHLSINPVSSDSLADNRTSSQLSHGDGNNNHSILNENASDILATTDHQSSQMMMDHLEFQLMMVQMRMSLMNPGVV